MCIFSASKLWMKAKQFTLKLKYEAFIKAIGLNGERLGGLIVWANPLTTPEEMIYFGDGSIMTISSYVKVSILLRMWHTTNSNN